MLGKVLNIHGYRGSAENSLYEALKENGYDVITMNLDYDELGMEKTASFLDIIIEKEGVDGVAGTSLGGFFAVYCSAKYRLPALLVNPSLLPEIVLPRLGYGDIALVRECTRIRAALGTLESGLLTTIIGTKDEVITDECIKNYTQSLVCTRRIIRVPGGRHSGSTSGLSRLLEDSTLLRKGAWLNVKDTKDDLQPTVSIMSER